MLLPEAEKQDQSRKESSATKDLGVFEEIIKEKNEWGQVKASRIQLISWCGSEIKF